jgi:hypothetical protein
MVGSRGHSGFSRRQRVTWRARIAIALTDDAMGRIHVVAAACRAAGFEHRLTLGEVGVLTGTAGIRNLPALRAIAGVLAVEIAQRPRRQPRMLCA